jgi:hypothetical protein
MEQLLLKEYNNLPAHLQIEVLHFIQFLAQKAKKQDVPNPQTGEVRVPLTFADFHFLENGRTYSRSEIYGEDGR